MDVTALPFNRFLGLQTAPPDSGFLVTLPGSPDFTNHLNTVHASALLAVAEAGSGAFLLKPGRRVRVLSRCTKDGIEIP